MKIRVKFTGALFIIGISVFYLVNSKPSSIIFINLPSLLFVLFMIFFVSSGSLNKERISRYKRELLSGKKISRYKLNILRLYYMNLGNASLSAGVIFVFIGFTQILTAMDDPLSILPACAIAMLPFAYSVIFNLIFVEPTRRLIRLEIGEFGPEKDYSFDSVYESISVILFPFFGLGVHIYLLLYFTGVF